MTEFEQALHTVTYLSVLVLFLILAAVGGGWLLEYTVETLAGGLGFAVDVPFPHLITMFVGLILIEVLIPLSLIVWLLTHIGIL